jgi:hypothetical protein
MTHDTLGAAVFRRHARKLLRESFQAAQGDQRTQVHFVQAYMRYLLIDGVPIDLPARAAPVERIRRQRLPAGHLLVPDRAQREAQFEFWWHLMWDLAAAVYAGVPDFLPSRDEIDDRVRVCGGTPAMSSFTETEMARLARTIALYRRCDVALGPDVVIELLLTPSIVRTELGFQGRSPRYPARPRTDGGDVHESRLLTRCELALRRYHEGHADIVDRIYRKVCHQLSWLERVEPYNPVQLQYRELIDAYNATHPDRPPRHRLHVPIREFPDEPARATRAPATSAG